MITFFFLLYLNIELCASSTELPNDPCSHHTETSQTIHVPIIQKPVKRSIFPSYRNQSNDPCSHHTETSQTIHVPIIQKSVKRFALADFTGFYIMGILLRKVLIQPLSKSSCYCFLKHADGVFENFYKNGKTE